METPTEPINPEQNDFSNDQNSQNRPVSLVNQVVDQLVPELPKPKKKIFPFLIPVVILIVLALAYFFVLLPALHKQPPKLPAVVENIIDQVDSLAGTKNSGVEKFKSEADFKNYFSEAARKFGGYTGGYSLSSRNMVMRAPTARMETTGSVDWGLNYAAEVGLGTSDLAVAQPERFSETNVQVAGIDEPDVIKTNGVEIYVSDNNLRLLDTSNPNFSALRQFKGTLGFRGFPLKDIGFENTAGIGRQGELLLYKDKLMIIDNQHIYAYDVSDFKNPQESWQLKLKDNNSLVAIRLSEGKLILVTRVSINTDEPDCLIRPLALNDREITINCVDIYHPKEIFPTDTSFSVLKIDALSGNLEDTTSFIGSSGSSIVYVSAAAAYVTYEYPGDIIAYFADFAAENKDLLGATVVEKITKLKDIDISLEAKMTELGAIFQKLENSLSSSERLRIENELENKLQTYQTKHQRELEKTGIAKIDLKTFEIAASGSVPGQPLNQFSLDEYDGYLRIATTFGNNSFFFWGGSNNRASDVYVLDKNLELKGSVKDLGKTERIYAVRFIADKGYVVTFRQTDPFYVLDLAKPTDPKLAGELKIPGYSSYLHPLSDDLILGVGKEGSNVKLSLFEVSDPQNPQEKAKYNMEEYTSEVLSNHHAFLLDGRHEVFFIPGSRGAYIFSYKNKNLELVKTVSKEELGSAQYGEYGYYNYNNFIRALYIEDYLYVVTSSKLIVLDEKDWSQALAFDLSSRMTEATREKLSLEERDRKRLADIKQIQTALELYFVDHNSYPTEPNAIVLGDSSDSCLDQNGIVANCDTSRTVYMSLIPANPTPNGTSYIYTSNGANYTLTFTLEGGIGGLAPGLRTASPNGIQ